MSNVRPPEPPMPPPTRLTPNLPICSTCQIDLTDPDSLNSGVHDACHEVKLLHVKTKKVGYLIGHHGRTIKGFENSSGARIDILVANSMSDETPVKISGNRKCVSTGTRMILDLFSYANFTSKMWNGEFGSSASVDIEKFFKLDGGGARKNNSMAKQHGDSKTANEEIVVSSDEGMVLRDVKLIAAVEEATGCKVIVHAMGDEATSPVSINVVGTVDIIPRAIELLMDKVQLPALPPPPPNIRPLPPPPPPTPSSSSGQSTAEHWELLEDALAATEPLSDDEEVFMVGETIIVSPETDTASTTYDTASSTASAPTPPPPPPPSSRFQRRGFGGSSCGRKRGRSESDHHNKYDRNKNAVVSDSLRVNSIKLACIALQPLCIKHRVRMELEQVGSDQNVIIYGPRRNVQTAKQQLISDTSGRKVGSSFCCRPKVSGGSSHSHHTRE